MVWRTTKFNIIVMEIKSNLKRKEKAWKSLSKWKCMAWLFSEQYSYSFTATVLMTIEMCARSKTVGKNHLTDSINTNIRGHTSSVIKNKIGDAFVLWSLEVSETEVLWVPTVKGPSPPHFKAYSRALKWPPYSIQPLPYVCTI